MLVNGSELSASDRYNIPGLAVIYDYSVDEGYCEIFYLTEFNEYFYSQYSGEREYLYSTFRVYAGPSTDIYAIEQCDTCYDETWTEIESEYCGEWWGAINSSTRYAYISSVSESATFIHNGLYLVTITVG